MDNKQKYIKYWSLAVIWIVVIWCLVYFLLPKNNTEEPQQEPEEVITENNNNDELCKAQYWVNSIEWDPWHCTCKEWYERNNWRTRCVKSRNTGNTIAKNNWIQNKYNQNEGNTFYWEWFEGEDDVILLPHDNNKWKKFEENSYEFDTPPDYVYASWEEIIEMVNNTNKIRAIRNEEDEDYLWGIINDINSKKKITEKNQNTEATNNQNSNASIINWGTPLIETFIWSIESKQTNEWMMYYYTFTDPSFWTTPVRIGFTSKIKITNTDISTDIWWNGVNINKLKFHGWIIDAEVTKDFWITRCWPFEPEGYVFNPWLNKFSLKGSSEEGFTYVNYFKSKIYPVFAFPRSELSQWNKNCMVEIGRKENFSAFPFELKWSFENAVVAVTKNKDSNSNCPALMWNHDNTIVIYNEELACEIWYNNWTSLREITTK